jgi:hypothetical protein
MSEPTDAQIAAEVDAILAGGTPADAPAPTPPPLDPTQPPPVAAVTPPSGTPSSAPAAVPPPIPPAPAAELDDKTARKIAQARQAQQQSLAVKQQADAALKELETARAELAAHKSSLERAKARGDLVELARLHGITPSRDHAEAVLAAGLGKDAPADLRLQTMVQNQAAELAALRQEMQQAQMAQQQAQQQALATQAEMQTRQRVRHEIAPKFGDDLALVRALVKDDENGDAVANAIITRYREMSAEDADVLPDDAAKPIDQHFDRMIQRWAADPVAAARMQRALAASAPKIQPTHPAEKPQPAPTIGNKHVSSTPPVAGDDEAYTEMVRREVDAIIAGQR